MKKILKKQIYFNKIQKISLKQLRVNFKQTLNESHKNTKKLEFRIFTILDILNICLELFPYLKVNEIFSEPFQTPGII